MTKKIEKNKLATEFSKFNPIYIIFRTLITLVYINKGNYQEAGQYILEITDNSDRHHDLCSFIYLTSSILDNAYEKGTISGEDQEKLIYAKQRLKNCFPEPRFEESEIINHFTNTIDKLFDNLEKPSSKNHPKRKAPPESKSRKSPKNNSSPSFFNGGDDSKNDAANNNSKSLSNN